ANRELAFAAALMFLSSPAQIVFAHELKPHAAAPFFVLATFYCLFRLLKENNQQWLWLAALACGGATAMIYTSELFILAVLCCVWFVGQDSLRNRFLKTCLCLALLASVYSICNPYVLLD